MNRALLIGRTSPVLSLLVTIWIAGGCATPNPFADDPIQMSRLKDRALEALKRGVGHDEPVVRAQAIESLQEEAPQKGMPWIRGGLRDEHPAVQFAAAMALGTLRDEASRESLARLLERPDDSVKAAAIFALHRMGDASYTGRLAEFLRDHSDLAVRCNAALVLGRLGETGAVPLLASVVGCEDDALHAQALEALVLLGCKEAIQQMTFVANSGNGPEEVFALNALAMTKDPSLKKTFEYKLAEGAYLETRLAAARGLGELGSTRGLKVALQGIRFNKPDRRLENDPPANQLMRVRQLAAVALGAIGDTAGLVPLAERLEDNSDARVQIACAKAILRIVNRAERQSLPFASRAGARR
jgi:HEAT repeat protein